MKCLDLTYLMEQRFRYTHIRDELEEAEFVGELRRKCEKCLMISDGEQSNESKELVKSADENSSRSDDEAEDNIEMKKQQKFDSTSKISNSKKEKLKGQPKKRKTKKKRNKSMDLKVLKRFWFKRDQSPPPKDELEKHLDELRMRTRNEIHTLVFLNSAAKEGKIKKMKMYTAFLNEKSRRQWNKYIEKLDKEINILPDESTEYNNNGLMERLKENPELLEAMDKFKDGKHLCETIMEHSYEIAKRIERQFFSLIPGIPGLITYRNAMICEIARDETIITVVQ
ncbi:unnamed protein product [Acanthocheilonema viteae]|uniref:Uncharacterized protein n=1 Tax=Acanthocheilonema viteae TaxID=6277 RepID=A0A498SPD3_ACAVI|nr:unnamed protein product [Acanthocheilonema viteae]